MNSYNAYKNLPPLVGLATFEAAAKPKVKATAQSEK